MKKPVDLTGLQAAKIVMPADAIQALGRTGRVRSLGEISAEARAKFVADWHRRADLTEDEGAEEIDNGMIPVVLGEGDYATHHRFCPHCHGAFEADQVALESYNQAVQIHAECVVELYRRLPGNVERVQAAYEAKRAELVNRTRAFDE